MAKIPLLGSSGDSSRTISVTADTRPALQALNRLADAHSAEVQTFLKMSDALYTTASKTSVASAMAESQKDISAYNEKRQSEIFDAEGMPTFANLIPDSFDAYKEIYEKNAKGLYLPRAKQDFVKQFDDLSSKELLKVGNVSRERRVQFLHSEGMRSIESIVDAGTTGTVDTMREARFKMLQVVNDLVSSGLFTPQKGAEISKQYSKKLGGEYISRFIYENPEGALQYLLENTSYDATLLDPSMWRDAVKSAQDAVTKLDSERDSTAIAFATESRENDIADAVINKKGVYRFTDVQVRKAIDFIYENALNGLSPSEVKSSQANLLVELTDLSRIPIDKASSYVANGLLYSKDPEEQRGAVEVYRAMLAKFPYGVKFPKGVERIADKVLFLVDDGYRGDVSNIINVERDNYASSQGEVGNKTNETYYAKSNKESQADNNVSIDYAIADRAVKFFFPEGNSSIVNFLIPYVKPSMLDTGSIHTTESNLRRKLGSILGDSPHSNRRMLYPFTAPSIFGTPDSVAKSYVSRFYDAIKGSLPFDSDVSKMYLVPTEKNYASGVDSITYNVFYYNPEKYITANGKEANVGLNDQRVYDRTGRYLKITVPRVLVDELSRLEKEYNGDVATIDAMLAVQSKNLTKSKFWSYFLKEPVDGSKEAQGAIDSVNKLKDERSMFGVKYESAVESLYRFDRNGNVYFNKNQVEKRPIEDRKKSAIDSWKNMSVSRRLGILRNSALLDMVFRKSFDADPHSDWASYEDFLREIMIDLPSGNTE